QMSCRCRQGAQENLERYRCPPNASHRQNPVYMSFGRSSSTVKVSVRYEAADTNTAHSTLTIRDEESAPRVPLPSSAWAFGNCPIGQASLVPDDMHICLFRGVPDGKNL